MKHFPLLICLVGLLTMPTPSFAKQASSPTSVTLKQTGKSVAVQIGGKDFTTADFSKYKRPILYPIMGPGQIGMTRNWPLKKDVPGEAHDHPHHQSLWIGHEISGVDFWTSKNGAVKTESVDVDHKNAMITSESNWIRDSDSKIILSDKTVYRFGGDETSRWIDCSIDFSATEDEFTFQDTKEGLFAIRTHPDLRLNVDVKRGVEKVFGRAINSDGVKGKSIWGKPAKWLMYFGTIDKQSMAIAMYDHPGNLRHPTTWHAREYGLVTANPFGLHYFAKSEKGAGAYAVKKGDSLTLRYRVEFLAGNPSTDQIEKRYQRFAKSR